MKHLLLSLIERVAARLPSALLMVLLAVYMDPFVVGLYAWMILALTFTQAAIDVPLRQVSIEAVGSETGRRFITQVARFGATCATVALVAVLLLLAFAGGAQRLLLASELIPLVFVPVATLAGIGAVARLQAAGEWGTLARYQALAALGALVVTLPFLMLTGSLAAAAVQPLLSEISNMALCRWRARRLPRSAQPTVIDKREIFREWRGAQAYSVLGWAQGQSDRIFVGALTGATRLGAMSYASALGRTGGEAVINGSVNVMRAQLRREFSPSEVRLALESAVLRVIGVATLGALAVWAVAAWLLPLFLSADWDPALAAAPILAVSTIPAAVAWHVTVVIVLRRRIRAALPARIVGIALGLLVAVAATQSLALAGIAIVIRELVVMSWLALLLGKEAPRRGAAVAGTISVLMCVTILVVQ